MLRLVIQPLPGARFEHIVEGDSVDIGRSRSCDVTLGAKFASRQHARIYRAEDGYLIEDLGSRNGTELNGERLEEPTSIHDGDVIRIANFVISVDDIPVPAAVIASSALHQSSAFHSSSHVG